MRVYLCLRLFAMKIFGGLQMRWRLKIEMDVESDCGVFVAYWELVLGGFSG